MLEDEGATPLAQGRGKSRGDLLGPAPEGVDREGGRGAPFSVGKRGREGSDRSKDDGNSRKCGTGLLKLQPYFGKKECQLPLPEGGGAGDHQLLVEEGGRIGNTGDGIPEDFFPFPVERDESRLPLPTQRRGDFARDRFHGSECRPVVGSVHIACLMGGKEGFATFLTPVA